MLTTEAFNALLKTLDEPPEHVIFILATTEVHKLPQTIRSRCQRFDFQMCIRDRRNAYGYRNFKRFRNRILHMFSHQMQKQAIA